MRWGLSIPLHDYDTRSPHSHHYWNRTRRWCPGLNQEPPNHIPRYWPRQFLRCRMQWSYQPSPCTPIPLLWGGDIRLRCSRTCPAPRLNLSACRLQPDLQGRKACYKIPTHPASSHLLWENHHLLFQRSPPSLLPTAHS